MPQATGKISYAMPTFFLGGNLIHFAAFKQHIGVYPSGSELGALKDEVARYRTSKGTLQFPLSEPIPYELIGRVAQAHAADAIQPAGCRARGEILFAVTPSAGHLPDPASPINTFRA